MIKVMDNPDESMVDFCSPSSQDVNRRVYLITYAKADLGKCPTRQSFAELLTRHFNAGKATSKVEYLAVCREKHLDGSDHYHSSLKMTGGKKWQGVKMCILREESINLNFKEDTAGYLKAYRYVIKDDQDVYLSDGHPKNLDSAKSPRTSKGMDTSRRKRMSSASSQRRLLQSPTTSTPASDSASLSPTSSGDSASISTTPRSKVPAKVPRFSNVNVSDMIFREKLKTVKELYVIANQRKEAGQNDLANFVLSRDDKVLTEIIRKTYLLKEAKNLVLRQTLARVDVVRKMSEDDCIESCEWLRCALQVLELNNIHPIVFATAVRELLIQGRGKYRNVMIIGERNCAKTFMLKPLEVIFACFQNPAKDKYAWVGVDEAEVILLQDFRWDSETIAWKNFLLLLEGETLYLPAPKNHFARDICVKSDIPIFATSKDKITYTGPNNSTCEKEDNMMECRWKVFKFHHEFPQEEQKTIPPCGPCFCKLALMGDIPC